MKIFRIQPNSVQSISKLNQNWLDSVDSTWSSKLEKWCVSPIQSSSQLFPYFSQSLFNLDKSIHLAPIESTQIKKELPAVLFNLVKSSQIQFNWVVGAVDKDSSPLYLLPASPLRFSSPIDL